LLTTTEQKRSSTRCQILNVDPTKRKSLLSKFLGASDDPVSIPTLATETAETAIRACRVAAIMSGSVRDVVGKNRKESTFSARFFTDQPLFAVGEVEIGQNLYIQGDPFSSYLKDSRALIWVWRDCGILRNDKNPFAPSLLDRILQMSISMPRTTNRNLFVGLFPNSR
jgi:hypothetical protein